MTHTFNLHPFGFIAAYPPGTAYLEPAFPPEFAGGLFLDVPAAEGWVTEDDARVIAEYLANRYGFLPYADGKVGEIVQLAPGTHPTATRAEVIGALRFPGDDYNLRALDGDRAGLHFTVSAYGVRHADAILPKAVAR